MKEALRTYSRLAKHVVVLGHTPIVVPRFELCLSGSADISSCKGTLSDYTRAKVQLEQHLAGLYGGTFIDTTPWFCYGSDCPSVIDNAPVFPDGNHVSAEIAPKFVPLLRAALQSAHAIPASN
jgi:hypothetical protein